MVSSRSVEWTTDEGRTAQMPGNCTDKELIRRIASGKREALAVLYDRYADDMMAVGLKYLDDQPTVEEVIHEVFLEVWRAAHEYDPDRGSVRTWLMVRMRSRSLDKMRYEGRRQHHQLEDVAEQESLTSGHDPAEAPDHEWVKEVIADLPDRLSKVLICNYVLEMTGPEIAQELDIPEGTVRSRLASARRALRETFADSNDSTHD